MTFDELTKHLENIKQTYNLSGKEECGVDVYECLYIPLEQIGKSIVIDINDNEVFLR